MRKIRIIIVGAEREGHSLYHCFILKPAVEIAAIVELTGHGLVDEDIANEEILITGSIQQAVALSNIDVIVETTKLPEVREEIYKYKHPASQVIESSGLDLLITLGNKRDKTEADTHSIRQIPDIIKLMEELQRSTTVIEGIYDKLGQINGLSDIYVSDVMPIDKMENLLLRQALAKYGFTVEGKKRAARALNISLATLYNKLKKYQIS